MRKIKINSLYKHFKGHIYKVIAIGKNSEDLTDIVLPESIKSIGERAFAKCKNLKRKNNMFNL